MKSSQGRGMARGYQRGQEHIARVNRENAERAARPIRVEVFAPEPEQCERNSAMSWLIDRGFLKDPWFFNPTARMNRQLATATYSFSVEL
jgi:hypothetical protein